MHTWYVPLGVGFAEPDETKITASAASVAMTAARLTMLGRNAFLGRSRIARCSFRTAHLRDPSPQAVSPPKHRI
jgi:hypothetical protein